MRGYRGRMDEHSGALRVIMFVYITNDDIYTGAQVWLHSLCMELSKILMEMSIHDIPIQCHTLQ